MSPVAMSLPASQPARTAPPSLRVVPRPLAEERPEVLRSYGGLHEARASVVRPSSVAELRDVLVRASREGRRVAVRGGGQSIDDRSLGGDLVVSTERLDAVDVDEARAEVTVGPGATWGAILRRLPAGLVPHVVVTTSAATAGGTLTAGCISRFSPCFGREPRHVRSFDLMTASGAVIRCTPGGENADVFAAVTAGIGYLGVITRITYALLDLRHLLAGRPAGVGLAVETHVRRHASFESMAGELLDALPSPDAPEAVYAVASVDGTGAVHRSRYVAGGGPLRPLPISRRPSPARLALEGLMWPEAVGQAMWKVIFGGYYRVRSSFTDDLFGFTFCMDTNERATSLYRRLGGELYLAQQTFLIPGSPADREASIARVSAFMREAARRLCGQGTPPTLFDVLYIAGEEGRYAGSFAVTAAFVATDRARVEAIGRCLTGLAALCRRVGGYVHLVKNVHARPEDLAAMHAPRLAQHFAVRRRLDPRGVMRNDFFDRIFASCAPPPSRPLPQAEARAEQDLPIAC